MKKIVKNYNLTDKREQYNFLNAPSEKMSDHIGERLEIARWAIIEDVNSDGEVRTSFVCEDTEGVRYGTNSRSFLDGLETYFNVFDDAPLTSFEVGSRKNKSGRPYVVFIA